MGGVRAREGDGEWWSNGSCAFLADVRSTIDCNHAAVAIAAIGFVWSVLYWVLYGVCDDSSLCMLLSVWWPGLLQAPCL